MAVVLTIDDHFLRVVEHCRIAVRGGEGQHHSIAGLDLTVTEHGVMICDSGHRHR